ncbi:MAG: tRNA-guanine transglycosylase DpdA, partial [Myxococcota bacterium]
ALGGLVPLKTHEILAILEGIREETGGDVALHLLGITRLENFDAYRRAGVVSFDSTSPLLRAFKDAKHNYYSADPGGHYTAVRIPQSDAPKMLRKIRSGTVEQARVFRAEKECRALMRDLDSGKASVDAVLEALVAYADLFETRDKLKWSAIRRTLTDQPWKQCPCPICKTLSAEVIIFRGANRNRRRGFHNLWWTYQQLQQYRQTEKDSQ